MDFFSGSTPNLVSNKSLKNMENLIKVQNPIKEITLTDTFGSFYNDYIEPNIFIIGLIVIFILFLIYKYYTKENTEPVFNREEFLFENESSSNYMMGTNLDNHNYDQSSYDQNNYNQNNYGHNNYDQNNYDQNNYDFNDQHYLNNNDPYVQAFNNF